jgi:ribosomal protein S18 acetylase RimI-like enzyme
MTTNGKPPNRHGPTVVTRLRLVVAGFWPMSGWSVAGRARLSTRDRSAVARLQQDCEAAEPIDLKIELDEADRAGQPIHFLAEADGDVIGYGAITAGAEAEVCGMVLPDWRRRGVATALLGEVRAAARRLERQSFLVICEDSGPIALGWMRRAGATAAAAERRMTVRLDGRSRPSAPPSAGSGASIELRVASDGDRTALIGLLREGFSETVEQVGRRIDTAPTEETLVATDEGVVVGTVRITQTPRRSMIYGFVIDAERRGRRLGTRMLAAVLDRLRADGVIEVGLEVNPENAPAVRLYEAFGFETVTTYRYMRLPSGLE